MTFFVVSGTKSFARVALIIVFLGILNIASSQVSRNEIKRVKIYPGSFNPSIGQQVKISLDLSCNGLLTVEIVDRYKTPVRTLTRNDPRAGEHEFSWDGKSENGEIVPDEAYSLRILQRCGSKESIYFPAARLPKELNVEFASYDPLNALLRYTLPASSRVQIQAGAGPLDPETKKPRGPVMKVPVNSEPRTAGKITEQWNGMAEGDSPIYIPDLPNFAFSIFAIELPENAIITSGNRKISFLQWAISREDLPTVIQKTIHDSHQGLDALNDMSPTLKAVLPDARWNAMESLWEFQSIDHIKVAGNLDGSTAANFAKQSGSLEAFIDQKSFMKIKSPSSPFTFKLPLNGIVSGDHILSLNWRSEFGMVAVNSMRLRINSPTHSSLKR